MTFKDKLLCHQSWKPSCPFMITVINDEDALCCQTPQQNEKQNWNWNCFLGTVPIGEYLVQTANPSGKRSDMDVSPKTYVCATYCTKKQLSSIALLYYAVLHTVKSSCVIFQCCTVLLVVRSGGWRVLVLQQLTATSVIEENLEHNYCMCNVEDFFNFQGPRSLLPRSSNTFESFRQLHSVSLSSSICADNWWKS